jgi:hypothetical protein
MLFDKHKKPVLSGLDEDTDWDSCEAFEDYVYSAFADCADVSDEEFGRMVDAVCAIYDEYYALHES